MPTDTKRQLRLEEPDGRYCILSLPESREQALLIAAAGIASAAEEGGSRARTLDRLLAGGPQSLELAVSVLQAAFA